MNAETLKCVSFTARPQCADRIGTSRSCLSKDRLKRHHSAPDAEGSTSLYAKAARKLAWMSKGDASRMQVVTALACSREMLRNRPDISACNGWIRKSDARAARNSCIARPGIHPTSRECSRQRGSNRVNRRCGASCSPAMLVRASYADHVTKRAVFKFG
jgi:hypothetical protein